MSIFSSLAAWGEGELKSVEAFLATIGRADVAAAEPIIENAALSAGEAVVNDLISGNSSKAISAGAAVLQSAAPQLEGIAINSANLALSNVVSKLQAAKPAS